MMGRAHTKTGDAKRERVIGCKPFCITELRKFTPELAVENTVVSRAIAAISK